jgi:hypothetical protein
MPTRSASPSALHRVLAAIGRPASMFGVANVLAGALVLFGVFVALPARWWPVDTGAAAVAALQVAAGAGLLGGARWGRMVAMVASTLALGVGLLTASTLAVTASWLSGVYGPVGKGGAVILVLVAALVLPYAVVLPALELLWLRGGRRAPE